MDSSVHPQLHPGSSTILIGEKIRISPETFTVIAGPCAIESEEQIMKIAEKVKQTGATILRGGAYKARTSPYSFQGLGEEGLKFMKQAADAFGLATVTEVVSEHSLARAARYVDMVQIGARNMQNFVLLKEVGRSGLPVLLKHQEYARSVCRTGSSGSHPPPCYCGSLSCNRKLSLCRTDGKSRRRSRCGRTGNRSSSCPSQGAL